MARTLTVRTLLSSALLTFSASTLLAGAAQAGDLDDIAAETPASLPDDAGAAPAAAPAVKAAKPAKAKPAAKAVKTATPTTKTAKTAAPAAKGGVSKADIDLWAFSVSNKLAPGKTLAEFTALPGLTDQSSQNLEGSDDAATAAKNPAQAVTLSFGDGLRVRVINFGDQAFITHVRVSGADRELQDGLKIGAARAAVEAQLGKPTRGGISYSVYEGATDIVRCFYSNNLLSAVEIDRGN